MFWENAALFAQVVPSDELPWGPELRERVAALPLPRAADGEFWEDLVPSDFGSRPLERTMRQTFDWRRHQSITDYLASQALSQVLLNPSACELLVSLDGQFDGTLAQFEQLLTLTHV
jgi:hypothetical protein